LKKLVSGELELLAEEVYHSSEESSGSSSEETSEESDIQDNESNDEQKESKNNESDETKERSLRKIKKNNSKSKKEANSSKRKHNIKHENITKLIDEKPIKKLKSKSFDINVNQLVTQKVS